MAEWRNPGYLHYYLWEEHFGRFVTNEFDRAEPWYYFIGVGLDRLHAMVTAAPAVCAPSLTKQVGREDLMIHLCI